MFLTALFACYSPDSAVILQGSEDPVDGVGWVDDVPRGDDPDDGEPVDYSAYDDATFRIVAPAPGSLVPLDVPVHFQAELLDADGDPLAADFIGWTLADSDGWDAAGTAFVDDRLPIGLHDLVATAELPNGDVLTYTAGGIRVQHPLGGTYAGFFSATGTIQTFSFTCSGSALIRTGPIAELAFGSGDCTASLIVFDLPLDWQFDLEVDPLDGTVAGTAGAAILGPITYDFPAEGTITADRVRFDWSGTVPFIQFGVDAFLDADRVSDDTL